MEIHTKETPETHLKQILASCKQVFAYGVLFGFISNLLMLAPSLYSLQILDRVISSGSKETLLMLSIAAFAAVAAMEIIQTVRGFMLIHMGDWLDDKLSPMLFHYSMTQASVVRNSAGSQQLRDFTTIKQFLTGPQLSSLVDSPWSIIFIVVLFLIHPVLGWLTVIGGTVLIIFAYLNERITKPPLEKANQISVQGMQMVDALSRNAEVIEGMGMHPHVTKIWHGVNQKSRAWQSKASGYGNVLGNVSKFIRLLLQLCTTGLGGYLLLKGELSSGAMIASSILAGRALSPFEAAITSWKSVVGARTAYKRLTQTLAKSVDRFEAMELPEPTGALQVENVSFVPPGSPKPVLRNVSFALQPGEVLGVIGPSASGKSTLAKLILGIWPTASGAVRLDDADVYQWKRDDFGRHVGYLPQDVELFAGTVKDNIARMDKKADPTQVVDASKLARIHEMVLRLSKGYDTDIGAQGAVLSAGQRQRVGLARAFYGTPKLVVLDEPNSNLDQEGDMALAAAIRDAKQRGITVIVVSHRPAIMAEVDKMLVLQDGQVAAFGSRDEVMAKFQQPRPSLPVAPVKEAANA